jgi:hypothetical protein
MPVFQTLMPSTMVALELEKSKRLLSLYISNISSLNTQGMEYDQ